MSSQINAIDKQSVHKICSGQVVLDLATAVKELVENSIDAGATSVDVKFQDNGIGGFEVLDNGSGIDPSNYDSLALKHYTSKINNFEDLEKVTTFGFRGEALSSLCALCNMTVITATKEQEPMGFKLEFDMNGEITSKEPVARSAGTTLRLSNIFYSLPVRQQEFKRNIKREFAKALTVLQAYSIISTNIRITVSNQPKEKSSTKLISTSGNKNLIDNISNVFGTKISTQVIPFTIDLESVVTLGSIEGYISKPEWGIGRNSTDRQYFYVNGRPCSLPKLAKTLNEVYRSYISNQYPVLIANLKIPTDTYDVNVSPDKRTIFIHNETKIAEIITDQLKRHLEPSRSTYQVNPLSSTNPSVNIANNNNLDQTINTDAQPILSNYAESSTSRSSVLSINRSEVSSRSNWLSNNTTSNRGLGSARIPSSRNLDSFRSLSHSSQSTSSSKRTASSSSLLDYVTKKQRTDEAEANTLENETMQVDVLENPSPEIKMEEIPVNEMEEDKEENVEEHEEETIDEVQYVGIKALAGSWNTEGRSLKISSKIPNLLVPQPEKMCSSHDPIELTTLTNASIQNTQDNQVATEALSRVINKQDFARMKVLGQFNLGFIITELDDRDLYIIDQHASDEKYNFETLQQTTYIETQRLLRPQPLELTASEEHVVMDNLEIFQANGFGVEVFPDNEPTKRVRVISHPVSKNTVFDKKDFSELIHLINENPGEMVRCSRIRAMFAMRACHKAVRIGQSLNSRKMTEIVKHMGDIDQPWNCPHGRPTMRHLLSLDQYRSTQPTKEEKSLTFKGSFFQNQT